MILKSVSDSRRFFHVLLWSHEMLRSVLIRSVRPHVRLTSDLMISAPYSKRADVAVKRSSNSSPRDDPSAHLRWPAQCPCVLITCLISPLLFRGWLPAQADAQFLENAKKLSMYGVYLHHAKVHHLHIHFSGRLLKDSCFWSLAHCIWTALRLDLWSAEAQLQLNKHSDSGKNILLPCLKPHRKIQLPALFPAGLIAVSSPNCACGLRLSTDWRTTDAWCCIRFLCSTKIINQIIKRFRYLKWN